MPSFLICEESTTLIDCGVSTIGVLVLVAAEASLVGWVPLTTISSPSADGAAVAAPAPSALPAVAAAAQAGPDRGNMMAAPASRAVRAIGRSIPVSP
jgi:hypothetical protein